MTAERSVRIANRNGIHARPAAEIVKVAAKFKSEIVLVRDDLEVNGKSIMGVMMLAAEFGSTLAIRAAVVTSARRWERDGVLRTIGLMWWLRLRYFFGASPARLARTYDGR